MKHMIIVTFSKYADKLVEIISRFFFVEKRSLNAI